MGLAIKLQEQKQEANIACLANPVLGFLHGKALA